MCDNEFITIDENLNLENLRDKIKRSNYKQLQKNVINAREEFSMEKNFPRLVKFIEDVRKS